MAVPPLPSNSVSPNRRKSDLPKRVAISAISTFCIVLVALALAATSSLIFGWPSVLQADVVAPISVFCALVACSLAFVGFTLLEEAQPDRIIRLDDALPDAIESSSEIFRASRQRLAREIVRLQRNSILNLVLGCIFVALSIAFSIFAFVRLEATEPTSATLLELGSRALLIFLLQIVGLFFLRLYEHNEKDIKHTKNEMTNVELWFTATQAETFIKEPGNQKLLIEAFTRVERNFILKKDERAASGDTDSKRTDLTEILTTIREAINIKT